MKTVQISDSTLELFARCIATLKPPPNITLSQWADEYRRVSGENSAETGRWKTSRAPYQREIMDAIGDPHIRKVVIMSAAQIGKTAMLLNILGYYMHYRPAPVLVMEPTLEMGETFSKDFLAPMLRDTPALKGLVDTRSRTSGNTILKKNFPGGHVTIVGANSPASLAMRPIKVVLADEIDRYPQSAGVEGDPLMLAQKRQTTFWDKKLLVTSTPTIKGISRVEKEFADTTREEWNVPCPKCGKLQPLVWANLVFNPREFDLKDTPKTVLYQCEYCGEKSGEYEWKGAGQRGKFIAQNPGAEARGFHLNTLASSFCGWPEVVGKFLAAKRDMDNGDYEQMKTWVNTELGETWEEPGMQVEEDMLMQRREIYDAEVPDGVLVLTAGIDTQDDRFEVEVVGWGIGKESWGIRYQKIYGDLLKDQVWNDLDDFLSMGFRKRDGTVLNILAACMDSGGHFPDQVLRFCKDRMTRRIFAIKGQGGIDKPFIRNPTKNNRVEAPLFTVGVDTGKAVLYQRLQHETVGPNYCHFPANEEAGYNREYFTGLTAERQVITFYKGKAKIEWKIRDAAHKRNEPLDTRNYATAALEIANPALKREEDREPRRPARPVGRRRMSGGIS